MNDEFTFLSLFDTYFCVKYNILLNNMLSDFETQFKNFHLELQLRTEYGVKLLTQYYHEFYVKLNE